MQTLLITFLALLSLMLLAWILGAVRRDVSIVDCFWGLGFVIVVWIASCLNSPQPWRVDLLALLTTVWGLRLAAYLTWRRWGQAEDRRYAVMREFWGSPFWWISLFTVFLLQAAIVWFVSLPLQIVAVQKLNTPLSWIDGVGILLFSVGFVFETIGDWQLAQFKAEPKHAGQVMDRGLWRYTRHPNYFGDFCVWWGLYFVSIAGGAWWTILSPVLMSILLLKVSGVSLLEKSVSGRLSGYDAYKSRTSAFIPRIPRSD